MLIGFLDIEINSIIIRNLDEDIECDNIEEYEELITTVKI